MDNEAHVMSSHCSTFISKPDRVVNIDPTNENETVFLGFDLPVTCQDYLTEIETTMPIAKTSALQRTSLAGEGVCGCLQCEPTCR
mmetsp:Transcript_20732/g.37663  ORF Transcript_20732/g.37663 Transcript_20732/m.37663 type:complete len:85 (+) Transcript_20732:65-319(+)